MRWPRAADPDGGPADQFAARPVRPDHSSKTAGSYTSALPTTSDGSPDVVDLDEPGSGSRPSVVGARAGVSFVQAEAVPVTPSIQVHMRSTEPSKWVLTRAMRARISTASCGNALGVTHSAAMGKHAT